MTVKELIEALQRMPQDSEVVVFDGQNRYTPRKVYVADGGGDGIKWSVVIDLKERSNE